MKIKQKNGLKIDDFQAHQGTTLDQTLYYVNSTCILVRAGLRFTLILHNLYGARQVFGAVVVEKFHVHINNSTVRYYSRILFILLCLHKCL